MKGLIKRQLKNLVYRSENYLMSNAVQTSSFLGELIVF